jgi:GntR family transcriptional regulator / MocR family aminotransferase
VDFLVQLKRGEGIPLHTQLESQIRDAIREDRLVAGLELPSTRMLAEELGVARGVVVETYAQLRAEGYLEVKPRGKTLVAEIATGRQATGGREPRRLKPISYDFHPGLPDLDGFPRAAWARSLRSALKDLPGASLGYGDHRGAALLREGLAEHLARARGALADPERLVVTPGFAAGLAMLCETFRGLGIDRVAVEDPCLPIHRAIIRDAGIDPVPIPVDRHGMRTEQLQGHAVQAVLVTPAHQFPQGGVLAPGRRTELIEWARRNDALVVEDDYDAEYRYDRDPIGALQGLAPERVVYGGSASKTLAPALRLGWFLLPERVLGPFLERRAFAGGASPILDQLTLAEFIAGGEYHRHLRRMRGRYRDRRGAMIASVREQLPFADLEGIAAGLHVVVCLPSDIDDSRLAAAARERGVSVHPLSWHRAEPGSSRPGLVLGYASMGKTSIGLGVREIARSLRSI